MAKAINQDITFELDYLFESGKDVFSAFRSLGTFYSHLHDFDKSVLAQLHPDIRLEYRLEEVSYGSLKSRVVQLISGIPDSLLSHPEVIAAIGSLLLEAKYLVLSLLSSNEEIDSVEQLERIALRINKGLDKIAKGKSVLATGISTLTVFKTVDELAQEVNKLPKKEAYQYKSKAGNAILKSGINVNKPKILADLGNTTETSDTTEIVKPKKVDLLGTSKWECILNGRTREMKVEDQTWLNKYHDREIDIQSGDSLKVQLRTTYGYDLNSKTKVSYEILKVLGVIKPDDTKQLSFNDNN